MSPSLLIGLSVLAVLAVGLFLVVRFRGRKELPVYHFQCAQCGERISYKARQAGCFGTCPRCGMNLTFPTTAGK